MLLICAIAVEKSTEIVLKTKDCGSVLGKFSDLDINCDEGSAADKCEISKGKSYKGTLKVTPNELITNATIVIHAIIGEKVLPFPFSDNDLCKNHNVVCPLKPNQEYEVTLSLHVPKNAPSLGLLVKMEYQSNGKDLVCVEYGISISSGLDQPWNIEPYY